MSYSVRFLPGSATFVPNVRFVLVCQCPFCPGMVGYDPLWVLGAHRNVIAFRRREGFEMCCIVHKQLTLRDDGGIGPAGAHCVYTSAQAGRVAVSAGVQLPGETRGRRRHPACRLPNARDPG